LGGADLGLARASLFGDKAGLAHDEAQDFARAGFADVLVLSGTHFVLALALWMLLAGRLTLWRRRRAWMGLAFAAAYASASGFEPPVCRALALVGVWLLARALDLECEAVLSLAFGAILVLLVQPGALWEAGFQLSFGACLSLVCLGPFLAARLPRRWPDWLRRLGGAQLALQWALLPLLAYHFHLISWPGLLGGLLAVLAIAVVLALGLPLAVLGGRLPGSAWLLGGLLHQALRCLAWAAQSVTHWRGSLFAAGAPSYLLVLGFLAWALACLAHRGPQRRLGLGLAAAGLLGCLLWPGLPWAHRHAGETRLWMLDVGQGDSLLLEFGDGRTLLMDAGPARPDAGAWSVVPALRGLGIQGLDWAAASHADADHVGGLATVLAQVPCRTLLWNGQVSAEPRWLEARAMARLERVPLRSLRAGRHGPDDGPWEVLNPLPPRRRAHPAKRPDTNRASLVLRVEGWLLLTGDLPKPTERRLERLGLARPVAVLKVGHHGSRSATSFGWARALHPEEALISCGARNSFGHPSAQALAALTACHARLWRTDLQGCVALRWRGPGGLEIRPWFQADPAALARPNAREASPWRGLDAWPEEADLAPDNPADFH
ncbi:MAG TPA: ComEC/Rec2 family competence protein, partial [bacterium]|nr:ComEC/Rec2 family competence protein [bacterium]